MKSFKLIILAARRCWRTGGLFSYSAYRRQAVHLAAVDTFPRKCVLVSSMAAAEPMADGRRKAVRALVAQPPGTHLRRAGCQQIAGFGIPDGVPHDAGSVFITRPIILQYWLWRSLRQEAQKRRLPATFSITLPQSKQTRVKCFPLFMGGVSPPSCRSSRYWPAACESCGAASHALRLQSPAA